MGNRAVISTNKRDGLYVHWNGGKDTLNPILEFLKFEKEKRTLKILKKMNNEKNILKNIEIIYKIVFGNRYKIDDYLKLDLDNRDNGVYIINEKDLNITKRLFFNGVEQNSHNKEEMIIYIKENLINYEFIINNKLKKIYNLLVNNYSFDYIIKNNILYINLLDYGFKNPSMVYHYKDFSKLSKLINNLNHNQKNLIQEVIKEEISKLKND